MQLKQRESVQARGETTQHHVLCVSASVAESDEELQPGPEFLSHDCTCSMTLVSCCSVLLARTARDCRSRSRAVERLDITVSRGRPAT
jgi:hypothetical protein